MANTCGNITAAPSPWTSLAAIREPGPGARAQAADAGVNTLTPMRKHRRRPNRSPSRAPVINATA